MGFKNFFSNLFSKNNEDNHSEEIDRNVQVSPNDKISEESKYDLSGLRQQVSETEYIQNLRVGRSWILPQLIQMGFGENKKGKKEFSLSDYKKALLSKYNSSPYGRSNVWNLLKRNYKAIAISNGASPRARWWTKEVAKKMMEWDFSLVGKARRGLDRKKCIQIINKMPDLKTPAKISEAIDEYDRCRMHGRDALHREKLPACFVEAFEGDGAFNAMMTMVKVLGLRLKDSNGEDLSEEKSIRTIEEQAKKLSGPQLLEYCKKNFFDNGVFSYQKYLNK